MSLQLINIGSTANDKSGDTLRTAGQKINSNFTELYAGVQVPPATLATLGTVRPDGTTVTINNGIITAVTGVSAASTTTLGVVLIPATATSGIVNTSGSIVLATASTTQLGGVKIDGSTIQISNGIISANNSYTLPRATTSTLGGVKVDGTTIGINNTTGVISAISSYTLPTASTITLGGVKVDGSSITINNGVISVSTGLSGTVVFKGTWNAGTNTPTLASGTGTTGWQYIVSVGATRDLGAGSFTYSAGDLVIYDGSNWIDISANNGVVSFNSRTGAITLSGSDVTTALGYTPIQSSSLSVATTTASGGGTLSYASGTFTFAPAVVPTYTVNIGTATSGGSLSLTGSAFTYNPATTYTLPTASDTILGGIKIDNNTIVINSGVISVGGALTSATIFKGSWNATTNTPTLSGNQVSAKAGFQYIVSVAGTQSLGGSSKTFNIGDLVIYDGSNWVQIPGSNNVQSFNTRQGAITLTSSDVITALGFTPIQSSSLSVTSNAASGLNSTLTYAAGVLTFTPASSASILNGISVSGSNGFAGSVSSGTITISTSITGLLKGNGTAISAAIAGTDYQTAVSATGLLKSNGTSGNISAATASDINSTFGSQTQNYVYAAPGGASGNPTFRALVAADIPTIHNAITVTSGSLTFSGSISAAAWTTSGIRHVSSPATLTDTTSTGTVANAYTNNFGGNTIAASNTVTYTNYGTVFLNDPVAGTNVTITNSYSLITAGNVKLGSTGTGTITAVAATATTASTAASLGYLGTPINTQAGTYTLVIGDAGKTIYAGGNLTIPANGTVAFPIGTIINVIASAGITIAITSDTLQWGGQATSQTGTRTVAAYGMASLVKATSTIWYISGAGVT